MNYTYLDHNIIQFYFEEEILLPLLENNIYVFSDVHFYEISRLGASQKQLEKKFLDALKSLKAQKIENVLEKKTFKITNEVQILPYQDPFLLYETYLKQIHDSQDTVDLFLPVQLMSFGNKDVDITKHCRNFEKTMKEYLPDFSGFQENANFSELSVVSKVIENLNDLTTKISQLYGQVLQEVKSEAKPIDQSRKALTEIRISDLSPENGPIIDQIWEQIKQSFTPLTKNQIFGKEPLPQLNEVDLPRFLSVCRCHNMLNFLGYHPDKSLAKEPQLRGSNADSQHIAFGSYCSVFITSDYRLSEKASAIFHFLDIPTQIIFIKLKE